MTYGLTKVVAHSSNEVKGEKFHWIKTQELQKHSWVPHGREGAAFVPDN